MTQFPTDTFMMLCFRSLPENAFARMESDVIDLANTYPQAIELITPMSEVCLYMQEQSEEQLKAMADDLGLAPFMYPASVSTSSVGFPATQENIAEVQAIISAIEEGFQYLLERPMRNLEYVAGIVFGGDAKAVKQFLSLPSIRDVQNHKPIDILPYQNDPNETEQKCLAKVLDAVRKRDADEVWAMRYIAKFLSTNENRRHHIWLDGLYTVATFAHVINPQNPKITWDQLFTYFPLDWLRFFEHLGSLSEKEQTILLDDCLEKTVN